MSLTRCLKKMGLSSHEAAILKGAAAEYREEGMQARDAAVMAVTDHAEQLLAERADVIAKVLKEAKARGVLADVQAALDAMPTFTRESLGIEEAANDDASAIDEAAHEAATSPKNDLPQPTDAQKEAGNYQKGHARLIGLDLSIENPAGSQRSGTDANGTAWSVTMRSHYGYIKGTVGKDKDHIDVFVKPGTPEDWAGPVFMIDQTKGNGHFDEHKVMIGFATEAEARAAYLANYTKGWDRLRAITETTPAEFKAWLKDGDTTKAFAEPRQGRVGMMLSSGQVVLTSSGRKTTPFPKVKTDTDRKATATVKAVDRWLIDNARDEAQARGDDFNATAFGGINSRSISQADKDAAEEYLFGEQPNVAPSILRPLIAPPPAGVPTWVPSQDAAAFEAMGFAWAPKGDGFFKTVTDDGTGQNFLKIKVRPWRKDGVTVYRVATMYHNTGGPLGAAGGGAELATDASFPRAQSIIREFVATRSPAPAASPELDAALQDAQDALGDLADIFSKPLRSNLTPEQEQKLLPVLTRLFDAAFRAGYYSFRDAARWVLGQIRERIGTEVADALTTEHLQGAYIGMSGRHKATGNVTPAAQVVAVEKGDIEKESGNAAGESSGVERDRANADAADDAGTAAVPDGPGDGAEGPGAGRTGAAGSGRRGDRGGRVPDGQTAADGDLGDQSVSADVEPAGPAGSAPGSEYGAGGDLFGNAGVQPDSQTAGGAPAPVADTGDVAAKRRAQREAEALPTTVGDIDNIRATLPFLMKEQQDDVAFAEARFSKPDGYGVLFTNGTGTGKTFTGLGVIKRFARAGRTNILIVAPNDNIKQAWIASAKELLLDLHDLPDTSSAGRGVTITTFANFGQNMTLADRNWDLLVFDEAHYLNSAQHGESTLAQDAMRGLALHDTGFYSWFNRIERQAVEARAEASARVDALAKNKDATAEQKDRAKQAFEKADASYRVRLDARKGDWEKLRAGERPRVTFLSATPFGYHKNIDYAEGFLFRYDEGFDGTTGYNRGTALDQFFMRHFGYRVRYNKLTKPDAEVDTSVMEIQFNEWMKSRGVLSSRRLNVAPDYDRRFILVDEGVGRLVDDGMEWLRTAEGGRFSPLAEALRDKFDFFSRLFLLESLKARAAVPVVREYLKQGRKVVVFHDFNKGGGFNPFAFVERGDNKEESVSVVNAEGKRETVMVKWDDIVREFREQRPDLAALDFKGLGSPLGVFAREFPDALFINGTVPKSERREAVRAFQDDDSGKNLVIAQQDAAREGVSLHDVTGKMPRVLINLGMPVKPIASTQIEGRIYRVGQASNATIRYLNTGTNWERNTFAQKIAERSSTAENLSLGNDARALKDAFIDAFENSGDYPPGMEGEGTGGKEGDRRRESAVSDWDRARSFYFSQRKTDKRWKSFEGTDYFATPEPLGLKMVQWADARDGDTLLEPSGGHGAIARWFPAHLKTRALEPSSALVGRLQMVAPSAMEVLNETFENHNVVNKYDVIVMNPPFGVGGKTAMEHVAKAAKHLRDGGRIVALIPRGPAADKRLEKFLYGTEERPVKPLIEHPTLGPIYKGDTVMTGASWAAVGKVTGVRDGAVMIKVEGTTGTTGVSAISVKEITERGPRTEQVSLSENLYLAADILLPTSAFERAGTSVAAHIVILEKQTDPALAQQIQQQNRDYSNAENIGEFFERIRDSEIRPRVMPARKKEEAAPPPAAVASAAASAPAVASGDIVEHVTGKGKVLRGIVRTDLTQAQARAIDAFTFKKDGGWFIREKHLGSLSRGAQSPIASRFRRASPEDIDAAVADLKRRLPGAPPIFVVKSTNDPRIGRSLARRMTAANAEGAYEGGRVYVVAPEMRSMEHVEGLLAHEVFHAALDLMGEEKSALLRSMQDGNAPLRTDAAALRARFPDMGELESVEEVLADYAREGREPTLMQRWANFIRAVLRKVGLARIAKGWTDGEVLGLVADAPRRAFAKRRDAGVRMYTEGRLMRGGSDEDVYRTVGGGRPRPGFPEATRIRGADGRPGTTYRGATRELAPRDFALGALGVATGHPSSGLGVWFAADEGSASRHGEVSRFHLDIRNPLRLKPETIPGFDSVEEAHRFRERARAKGHDGIIVDASHLGGPVYYVAFDPEQVVYPVETGRLSRANQNLAQPLSDARYTEADQARAAEVLSRRRGAQALDALVRVPMQALRLDRVTATVIDGVLEKLGSLASTVAPQAWERAKAGLVDQYGLPQDVKDQRSAMQGRMRAGVRSSKHAIDALANLTRAESRVLYEYVNGDRSRADLLKAGLPEESVRIIDLYQRVADEMGQEAVRLGQLSPDAFEAHRWAYVHRSYQKHVLEMPEQAKVERSRALKVRGDQYKGRGMSQAVPMKAIQNVAPAWWRRKTQDGKADKGLRGESFIRFDRRAAVGEGTADLEGFGPLGRRGRILETHYWPAGEPVPAMYSAWERDAAPWTARDTKGANLLLARDFTQGERQAMGEVDEIRYGMAATLHKMIHDIEVGRMLEYLAVHHGKTDETLPQGANLATDTGRMMSMTRAYTLDEWVLVPESKIPGTSARAYGALAGMYVPGPVWNDVRQIVNTNIYPLGQTYADLLRAWKLSKTALSLPVHMNNVMSNVLMADFHDVTAKDVLAALEVMRHRDRPENALVLERFEDAGGSEGLYNLTELQKETIQPLIDQLRAEVDAIDPAQGIARVSSIVTLITQMRFREAFALAAQSKAGKSGAFVRDKLVKAYENEDLVFRLAAFIRAKGDGSSDVEAGRQARQSFLDYQINAPWINLMRSTAFPFISFTYRALPMMLHTAKTKPWKVVKWGGIMGLLNLIGYAVSGGDEDKERRLLPEEVAGRTILGSPKLLRAPWNDEHGSPVFLDVRRWIPVGDIVDWGQTHSVVPFFPQLMPSGPAGLFAELALNKSAFTGKEITQETDTAAEMAGKLADYLYKAFAPNTPGVPFAYSTDKILGAGGGKTDAFGREQSVMQAASSSIGVKLATYPLDVMQRNAVIQFRARDAEIKANVSKLQRELQRKGIDPDEFEAKVQRQNEKRIELATELAKKMGQQ